ncbi:MAG: hypothetical protein ACLPYS_10470 [Vulcanimicrobiaceae bacterium]
MSRQGKASRAWGVVAKSEPRWPASLAVVVCALLNLVLPGKFTMGPVWLVPVLEAAILLPLSIAAPRRLPEESRWSQIAAVALIALVNLANLVSLILLIRELIFNGKDISGPQLLISSVAIWVTNVIVFSLWYWELDRGGPDDRLRPEHEAPDFLFPQMTTPGCAPGDWTPGFLDYLYVAFTNATAFSPTDTMPLTPWAKTLMLLQASASLITIAIVAARAVNILS